MSLAEVLRLLLRHWKLLLAVPLVLGTTAFLLTRHEKKTYTSETTLYTGIASGYTLKGNAETDFFSTNNAFDNLLNLIKSRETKEEVAYQLLTHHLQMKDHLDPARLNWNSLMRLHALLPAALRQQLTGPTQAETLARVRAYAGANDTNELYLLLNSFDPTYSVDALGHVNASRIQSSDLVKLDYEAEDPAICRHTLELTTQVFSEKYRGLRMDQTATVIKYYEVETARALVLLNTAEDKFLAFNRDNNIINYYEQTKYIAGEREGLYADITKIQMQYAAAKARLAAIELKLAGRNRALLSTGELLQQRRELEQLQAGLANQQLYGRLREPGTPTDAPRLQARIGELTEAMRTTLNDHYSQLNSVEGIPSKGLIDEWLRNMLECSDNKAKLEVMLQRKQEFMEEYHKMAPLGATLKRIEREIELTQKTYLALLTSLNDSRASQQNNELTTDLKVVAPPFLPLHAKGGKRLMLVAGGSFGGFFFVAATLLGLGLLDKSLRKPSVAASQTGLPVLGVLPPPSATPPAPGSYADTALDHLARQVVRRAGTQGAPTPFVVGLVSTRRHEGKTQLLQALAIKCRALGLEVLTVCPEGTDAGPDATYYPPALAVVQRWPLARLTQGQAAHVVLLELPALLEDTYPVAPLTEVHLLLLALKNTRTWEPKDAQALQDLRSLTMAPVEAVLCGVQAYESRELLVQHEPVRRRPRLRLAFWRRRAATA
ncbi:Wzz/FepE/Etk N-terminal domain-containing protein [Hymenobacter canadensis]|uniref:Wzz/FepE/Etk N-terminal domain-containing protein n=1 Tax=Hymenobacter canadensis TaxID=2999067 RepID=A0ABY7LVY1_9BACT|nr:Wzz/FepE/Etk N-terminal domain-containing protein [Hymenobacter canadensis]WBA43073.1 Wzz/FepE/Etk N-terminal domain-containing protein [Hymenobacter canadensis]